MQMERDFDPEAVRQMKVSAGRDMVVGGPELAAQAFKAGLVDECHLFVAPMVVGGGKQSLPDDVRLKLDLLDEHRFASGMVYLWFTFTTAPGTRDERSSRLHFLPMLPPSEIALWDRTNATSRALRPAGEFRTLE